MGWFSDIFSPEFLLPIAAGMAFGPGGMMLAGKGTALTATAAGATAGGGLAALRGDDIASGAIGGGLGGMSGGNIYSAFNPAATSGQIAQAGGSSGINTTASTYNPVLASGDIGARQSVFTGKGIGDAFSAGNYGEALGGVGTGFKEGVQNLGGGGKFAGLKGAGKLASMGVMGAGIGGGFDQEPMEFETPEKYKYDPTRQLNLGDDVDSGLRLLANGGYLEGGGVGDGMSDDIPATIDQEQPAALSEGEFVIPADVVSHIGNGSSNAGARRLYDMMATIREARTGNSKQGVEIEAEEYMPMSGGIGTLA